MFGQTTVPNRLLKALSPRAFQMLRSKTQPVALPVRSVQVEPNQATTHVLFLESGLGSVIARTSDDEAI
jgi:hypothetical protein